MLSAPLAYQMISRDMTTSLGRVAQQPAVSRDSEYYQENIGKVETIEEFFGNYRLYSYAMKAYGLSDMTYAKAFMRKVLESDLTDGQSFANKLVDKRYQEFARAFAFAKPQAQAPSDTAATLTRYQAVATEAGLSDALFKMMALTYTNSIGAISSVDEFLVSDTVYDVALSAYGIQERADDKAFIRRLLTSDPSDPDSFANRQSNPAFREFANAFNFSESGNARVQTYERALSTRDSYVRQTLESDAGQQNEGVRLALYFERKAPSITSAYSILADKALLKVVQTALGLSEATGNADVDIQAKMIEARLDLRTLKTPEGLQKFLNRFTALWEVNNPSTPAASPAALFGPPSNMGINPNTLMTLQGLKLGGR
jgi:hypothetical protein